MSTRRRPKPRVTLIETLCNLDNLVGKTEFLERALPILTRLAASVEQTRPNGTGATMEVVNQDQGLAVELPRENGIELPVVKAAREMFKRAHDAGWGKATPRASSRFTRARTACRFDNTLERSTKEGPDGF